jgi:hypothetical protein
MVQTGRSSWIAARGLITSPTSLAVDADANIASVERLWIVISPMQVRLRSDV